MKADDFVLIVDALEGVTPGWGADRRDDVFTFQNGDFIAVLKRDSIESRTLEEVVEFILDGGDK